jgi:DNA-directed RNA polymerase
MFARNRNGDHTMHEYGPYTDAAAVETERLTIERFNRRQDRLARDRGFGGTAWGLSVTKGYVEPLAEAIAQRLSLITQSQDKVPVDRYRALAYVVKNLDPVVLSVATLQGMLHSVATQSDLRHTCENVGSLVHGEAYAAKLLQDNPKLYARIERYVRDRNSNERYRRQAARSLAQREGFRAQEWPREQRVLAGNLFVDIALDAFPQLFVKSLAMQDGHRRWLLLLTEGAQAFAEDAVEEVLRRHPAFLPCTEEPQPWTRWRSGGFWDERCRFAAPAVRAYHKDTIAAMKVAVKEQVPHFQALNSLQRVAWTINQPVLDMVQWCYENNVPVKGVPRVQDIPLPARLSDEEWQYETNRRRQRTRIAQVKERNRQLVGDRVVFAEDMRIAAQLGAQQQFYTPANCDWRGRFYSIPHFAFSRDDRVRALFLFRDGMPIGEAGLYWLKVHVANCGDYDKISKRPFEERVAWVNRNIDLIKAIAEEPKTNATTWAQADKPFLFLAACLELTAALAAGQAYVTRLPISFDGSCSGLQHLCAMTRASEGSLVNLTPQELPQDVYQTVADLVLTRVREDAKEAADTRTLAELCLRNGITRKLVKRNVMTYSYSSKRFGMAAQHIEDTMEPLAIAVLEGKHDAHPYAHELDGERKPGTAAAQYLAGHIYAAIESVVHLPAQAMACLQKIARALAHEGKPARWTTPSGLPWINRYHEPTTRRVGLWLSDTKVSVYVAVGNEKHIAKDKAANGIAPNFVHALDASHLALTVNACVSEGIVSIATVHDSFGCLAPQASRFRDIIREQFVQMYETHDVLAEVLDAASHDLTVHNLERLPELPVYGPLNLKDVLHADFAFA